jgi:hypothetical protein
MTVNEVVEEAAVEVGGGVPFTIRLLVFILCVTVIKHVSNIIELLRTKSGVGILWKFLELITTKIILADIGLFEAIKGLESSSMFGSLGIYVDIMLSLTGILLTFFLLVKLSAKGHGDEVGLYDFIVAGVVLFLATWSVGMVHLGDLDYRPFQGILSLLREVR